MNTNIYEIINKMPKNLSDIEKVRYMYLNCGELFTYDRDYIYAGLGEVSKEMYEKKFIWPKDNSFNYQDKPKRIKVTCNQIVDGLNSAINIMKENVETNKDIHVRKIGYVDGAQYHVVSLVKINDDMFYLDLYKDLYRIQRGMRTKYFAPSEEVLENEKYRYKHIREQLKDTNCKSLSDEEIMTMDKKCEYNKNGIYIEDVINQLKEEMKDEENLKRYVGENEFNKKEAIVKWKLDYICKYLISNKQENSLDISEFQRYFTKLYNSILTEEEKLENIMAQIDIHLDGEESVLFYIYTGRGIIYYLYKGKDAGIERISEEELNELRKKRLEYDR